MSLAPSLYEYYTSGGITSGLSTNQSYFTLNNRNITIFSGAMHYFRVPPQYWRDRLRKMRAAGLNTVETYIPWNVHEPEIGKFDFGEGGTDMEAFLNVHTFIKTAQEEDLFVIVRPGPYICAEWEFGGLPAWLLRHKDIKVRTSDSTFMNHVARFFSRLLPILVGLQFMKGGPIIGFQVENEYGSTEFKGFVPDKEYLKSLKDLMLKNGVVELLFTSDSPFQHGDRGALPGVLQTANFARDARKELDSLKKFQSQKPLMVMEYWTGWFDHWSEKHNLRNNTEFRMVLQDILNYPASVNMYMFHGGTNWGFLNGANVPRDVASYQPDTTSYDYDAPLAENGDYTEKYYIVKELLKEYNKIVTRVPSQPSEIPRFQYPTLKIIKQLKYSDTIAQLPVYLSENIVPMELLPSRQNYGYIIYRTMVTIPQNSTLQIKGYIHDSALILIDGILVSPALTSKTDLNSFGYWRLKDGTIQVPAKVDTTLDIVVENWGRNNFGKLHQFQQFKGLTESVFLNDIELKNWEIRPLEFKTEWTQNLSNWNVNFKQDNMTLNKAVFDLSNVYDTYIDMSNWNTGIVIVNGFVLGRYMKLGPPKTLYLPGPLLKMGRNEIIVFEHFIAQSKLHFSKNPIYSSV